MARTNRIIIAMNKMNASAGRRQLVRNRRLVVVEKRIAELRSEIEVAEALEDNSHCKLNMEFSQLLCEGEMLRTGCTGGYDASALFDDSDLYYRD